MNNTPYTYLIGWSKLGIWYYGCRYSKSCRPDEFWVSYHTSSKSVREFRKTHGEPDVLQVRKTFKTGDSARSWEERVIRRMKCVKSDSWLNKANAGKEWNTAGKVNRTVFKPGAEHLLYGQPAWNRGINGLPEKEIRRRSIMYSGSGNPNYGKSHTPEAIATMKDARKSKNPNGRHAIPHTAETRKMLSEKTKAQGNHAAKTKVCCAFCQKETSMIWFAKNHQNCSEKYAGTGNPNYGKKHSPEAIAKIKENRMSKNPNGRHAIPHSEESNAIIKAKARKQAEAGGMAAHTKVCCVGCRKETNIPGFKRAHQNCSA